MRYFLISLLAVLISACSNDMLSFQEFEPEIKLVDINKDYLSTRGTQNLDGPIFSFKSQEVYENFLSELKGLSVLEKQKLVKRYGFVSLVEIANQADQELESIAAACKTEEDFRSEYQAYKNRYKEILVDNPVDSLDLSLYTPATDNEDLLYLINGYHKIIINGKIVDVAVKEEMNEKDRKVFANNEIQTINHQNLETRGVVEDYSSESQWPVNGFIEIMGSKKTIFDSEVSGNYISFHFGSQKKMWYGWKRDSDRCFYFRLANLGYWHVIKNKPLCETNVSPSTYYFSYNNVYGTPISGSFEHLVGECEPFPSPLANPAYTAKIYVWTDLMCETDSNGNTIYQTYPYGGQVYPINFPLFITDHSFPCKISLTR